MELLDSLRRKKEVAGIEEHERWQIGDRIENRYEIHKIKRGGFGVVYICYDHEDKGPLAIKTFQTKFLQSQRARDDFTSEAEKWIKLDKHKNIVRPYYVKNIEGQPYIFVEYAAGGNLDDWLYTKMLDLPLALNFAIQFCNGMYYAYNKMKLVHRDIKPGNILLTRDKTVKITDFGLAKAIEARAEQIAVPRDVSYVQSSTAGTLPYMAPEQFTCKEIDTKADIYAFGIVLYQMVTSSYPYQRKSSWKEMHLKESPIPIKQGIPAELAVLIGKCLEKDPAKRYQNFSEMRQDISKIYFDLTGETIPEESGGELEVDDLINKGNALAELDRSEEAITCYDKALDINPRDFKIWCNKGTALDDLGRQAEAITWYDKGLDLNPRDDKAWYNKGNTFYKLHRSTESISCYDKALDINPRYALAWLNKGVVLHSLGRGDEAIACYDKALDINPRYADAWNNKGVALFSLGRGDEAILSFQKFIEFAPPQYASHVERLKETILMLKKM